MIKLIKEGISKPFVDWSNLINIEHNGINRKIANDFSKTYRLNQDFGLGPVEEIYKWGIEDNFLSDLIENKGFWTDEQGNVAIPKGTEFTFYFYPDDDGRQLYIYFLNVPELKKNPAQWWTDRYYNDDEWAYEIINSSTPVDSGLTKESISIKEDIEGIRFCVLQRNATGRYYTQIDWATSLTQAQDYAEEYADSDMYQDHEYWAFDTKKWRAYPPTNYSNQKFNSNFPIYHLDNDGKAELLSDYVNRIINDATGRWTK